MSGQSQSAAKKKTGGFLSVILTVLLVFSGGFFVQPAHAAGNYIRISQNGGFYAAPGDKEHPIEVTVTNNDMKNEHTITVKLGGKSGQFSVKTKPMRITLAPGESTKLTFAVDVARGLPNQNYTLVMTAEEGEETVGSSNLQVSLTSTNGTYDGLGINYAMDNADGLQAGAVNELKFELYNRGSVALKDVSATLTLPEGMSINNASSTVNAGYIHVGDRYNAVFPLLLDETLENKNYPIKLQVAAKVSKSEGAWEDRTFEETFYISVTGGSGAAATKNISIGSVSAPEQTSVETDFVLSFVVKNNGTSEAKNLKVSAELPSGLLNKTTATFVENSLAAGAQKEYKITLMATDESKDTTYPIKISVDSLDDSEAGSVMQYTSVYVKSKEEDGSVKSPRLMVDTYDYGGGYVKAGDEFSLTIGLVNTAQKTLSNIKVTVNGGETFVPVNSSNAFFIDDVASRAHYSKTLRLKANATAEQSTATVTVNMSYEDSDGNEYTAEDTISIPIVQDTRLEINDVASPWECYVGSQTSTSVEFYNMGKTTLNNLRVTATGNFDTMESNSYYVGNMASGSTDDFSFSFIPREVGPVEGTIIFTYEDASGTEHEITKEFVFEAMEMPVWDETGMDEMPVEAEPKTSPTAVAAAVAVVAVAALIGFKAYRKKKLNQQLEMEDE